MRIRVAVLAAAVAGSATLAACSDSTSGKAETPPPTTVSTSSSADTPSAVASSSSSSDTASTPSAVAGASTSSGAGTAQGTPVAVNKSFSDPDIGESGTVLKVLRNFAVSAATKAKYSALADQEVVLVEVTVHSSRKYYDSLGSDSFFLLGDDKQKNSENDTVVSTDMAAAGYPVLKDAENGASQTGWLAFPIDKGNRSVTLQYYTLAYSTSGGKTIPAKTIDIPLP